MIQLPIVPSCFWVEAIDNAYGVRKGERYKAVMAYSSKRASSGTQWRIRLLRNNMTYDPKIFRLPKDPTGQNIESSNMPKTAYVDDGQCKWFPEKP